MSELVERARATAERLMADELPRRWQHVQKVAAKATAISPAMRSQADLLVAAAWLHDIGYARELALTGFHPLDGARYLRARGEQHQLCCLVANHSAAALEAELRGLSGEMSAFPDEHSPLRDAVWSCDMTTGPTGESISFTERLAEIRRRYPDGHTVPTAIGNSSEEIAASIARTRALAESVGAVVDLRV
jgi:putative nucleotidyltransferase with HDIG domain